MANKVRSPVPSLTGPSTAYTAAAGASLGGDGYHLRLSRKRNHASLGIYLVYGVGGTNVL